MVASFTSNFKLRYFDSLCSIYWITKAFTITVEAIATTIANCCYQSLPSSSIMVHQMRTYFAVTTVIAIKFMATVIATAAFINKSFTMCLNQASLTKASCLVTTVTMLAS